MNWALIFISNLLRVTHKMRLRRRGVLGEREARTQGAFVPGGYGRD
jgi:hypothetical protein